ncbi:ATP-binding protein [Nocardia mikamii]|uniref:ATP-binding protein n=1 Tax=Nocardia mikamii TaxID=508464 RepID=UPI001FE176C9|nr:ATP-binding protein [Nocardia mikamii]
MYPSMPAFDARSGFDGRVGFEPRAGVDGLGPDGRGADPVLAQPRLLRRSGGRVVGGVAGGIADHLGVDVFKVRMAFVLLSALMGAGIVAYGLLWIFTSSGADGPPPTASERRQAVGLVLLGLALSVSMAWLFNGTAARVVAPIIVVAVGAALVWREFDAEGPRSILGLPARPTVLTWTRILAGATLIVVGLGVVVLARIDLSSLGSALIAVAVTLIGVGLLTVPLWLRMMRALNAERAARIRNEEREEIASHLHDSVLQTLALIQRQADDPQEVARLARSQERELRKWLFEDSMPAQSSLAAALRTIAGEVEDQHGVQVTPVTVGDVSMDVGDTGFGLPKEHFTALLGATREALVNAAKHAGVPTIDVFAEVEPHQVSIFVRDRGTGFDPAAVPADRQGLAKSIHARIERRGGTVEVQTAPGRGTEVRIMMPRKDSEGPGETGGFDGAETEMPASGDADRVGDAQDQAQQAETQHDEAQHDEARQAETGGPRGETAETGPRRSR